MAHAQSAGNGTAALREIDERIAALRRDADNLLGDLDTTRKELGAVVREQLKERPYTMFATAALVGYVAGGGLPSRLTRFIVALGSRIGIEYVSRQFAQRIPRAAE